MLALAIIQRTPMSCVRVPPRRAPIGTAPQATTRIEALTRARSGGGAVAWT